MKEDNKRPDPLVFFDSEDIISSEEDIEPVVKKLSPFDIINNINGKKARLSNEEIEDFYVPFVINKAFSQSRTNIFFADMMNSIFNCCTKKMQYDFYYGMIPKNREYNKWNKRDTKRDDIINIIQRLYGYSYKKALQVLPLFENNMVILNEANDTGGRITKKIEN